MGHCYHHALSSVRKWGGVAEDYLPLHQWFDLIWTVKPFFGLFPDGVGRLRSTPEVGVRLHWLIQCGIPCSWHRSRAMRKG